MYNVFMFRLVLLFLILGSQSVFAQQGESVFALTSVVFSQSQEIPAKYTCQGGDVNPPLVLSNIPKKTKSFALTVHSPDAPEGTWVHWVVYNIPPDKNEIAENTIPGEQSLNDFGKYNYSGPCPTDEKTHTFIFQAYALDDVLVIDEGMTMVDLERAMAKHILAQSQLTGNYRKPVW